MRAVALLDAELKHRLSTAVQNRTLVAQCRG